MPDAPKLSVLIISYNTREMTLRCLRTLYDDLGSLPAEVLVVDNCSKDGSADAIAKDFPAVILVRNDVNVGFGAANNQALQLACGDLFLMLNTDAFGHPGCCRALVEFMGAHQDAGVVGARLLNEDGSLQVSCYPFPTPFRSWAENLWLPKLLPNHPAVGDYRSWKHDSVRKVDWVVGACLVCRREVIEQVGGFDPLFFMYSEETDWQQRIRRAGWQIYFTPEAVVTHLGGASGTREPETISRYFFSSFDLYALKNHGVLGFLLTRLAMIVGAIQRLPGWAIVWLVRSKDRPKAWAKIRHYVWLLWRQLSTGFPTQWREYSSSSPESLGPHADPLTGR